MSRTWFVRDLLLWRAVRDRASRIRRVAGLPNVFDLVDLGKRLRFGSRFGGKARGGHGSGRVYGALGSIGKGKRELIS